MSTLLLPGGMKIEIVEPKKEDLPVTWRGFSDARGTGLAARVATWDAWVEEFGHFASVYRSHTWQPAICDQGCIRGEHEAWVFHVHLGCGSTGTGHWFGDGRDPCQCVGGDLERVVCSCGFESEPVVHGEGEDPAFVLMDHCWPGWREMPIAPKWYHDGPGGKSREKAVNLWLGRTILEGYSEEWLREGGPIRTHRRRYGTRSHGGGTPFGGWDMCGEVESE